MSILTSSTAIQGIIIQKFTFSLSCQGETFYEGMAVFGYFQPESLENQVGLDQGKYLQPWHETDNTANLPVKQINLGQSNLYQAPVNKPHYHLAPGQLNFLDEALIIPNGGETRSKGMSMLAVK